MSRIRQTQHRAKKDPQEVRLAELNELRKENHKLKREVARLKREILKRGEFIEPLPDFEPMAKDPVVITNYCPKCNAMLKEAKVLNKIWQVCPECQYRKVTGIQNDPK